MKKLISENLFEFERGISPKISMGVGTFGEIKNFIENNSLSDNDEYANSFKISDFSKFLNILTRDLDNKSESVKLYWIKYLIDKIIEVEEKQADFILSSCFSSVLYNANIEFAKVFLKNAPDKILKQAISRYHMTSFNLGYRPEIMKILIDSPYLNKEELMKKLYYSSIEGSIEYMKFLIDNGLNIHYEDEYFLRWSIQNNLIEIAEYLLEKGAIITSRVKSWVKDCDNPSEMQKLINKYKN